MLTRTMTLDGRVALVTGGSRGIGQAAALALAKAGADVAFCDVRTDEDAGETIGAIRLAGRRARYFRTDVRSRSDVFSMVDEVVSSFGQLDILVNNAAVNVRKPLIELEPEDVERVWGVTLWGVFHCSQAAARHMVTRRRGSLVMISSIHAERAFPNNTAYNGAKAAVNQMARTWAAELAPHGIRVNIVEPGWTDTPGERSFYSEAQILALGEKLPLKRLASPGEIASAVAFLASDEASYITGASLRVDGGIFLPPVT